MTSTPHLSQDQRVVLVDLLQSRLTDFEQDSDKNLNGMSQIQSARHTLLQDADDARQRDGEHEVEALVADIDCSQFLALHEALDRIHRASYGLCIGCKNTIPFGRLLLEPHAMRCMSCQAAYERNILL